MKKAISVTAFLLVLFFVVFSMELQAGVSSTNSVTALTPDHTSSFTRGSDVVPLSGQGNMLQFTAGGHVLGFLPTKAYLASLDHALSVEFLGTPGIMPESTGTEPITGTLNKAPTLRKVLYQNLWEGISLTYESTQDGITESTYHIAPGADVAQIRLRYNVPVSAQKDGSLKFAFERGYLTESKPIAWQEINGKRTPVTVAFKVSRDEVGFSVGDYNPREPLIIDPTYAWHTFYGSSNEDRGWGIAVDTSGNVYVTGYSGASWGTPIHAHSGGNDLFVLKLNSSGAYQWHTFYGSSNEDRGWGIAVDTSGNVYVTGVSRASWGSPIHAHSGGSDDIFVLKLNSSGAYQWHTFYGSSGFDYGCGITVDTSGNVYVTGIIQASWGTPIHAHSGSNDLFVLKLNSSGAYQWHTFYGSSNYDRGWGIAVDTSGNVYVTGNSYTYWGSPLHAHSGSNQSDLFVLKLNSSGAYQWHTFYGSSNEDQGWGIAVDTSENVYVTGYSGAHWGSPIHAHSGSNDLFVLKLNSSGAYQWHTFYGSSNEDQGWGIAVDTSENVYVTGYSGAHWGSPIHAHSGGDIVVLRLVRESLYSIIQNCRTDSSSNTRCTGIKGSNDEIIRDPINDDTIFRIPRHGIVNSEDIISPWYDGDWQNLITNSTDTSFNTVHKGTPLSSDKFEVISYVDDSSPMCGTKNEKSYFFTYTIRDTPVGHAVLLDDWINYLKAITLDYGRPIDTLTIFSHASAGDVAMSEAFHLTEQTAPLFSRLKTENILAPNATILLFACQAGAGDSGQRFVQVLANATGATVYANTEYTGDASKFVIADWSLDVVRHPQILYATFPGAGIWKLDDTTWTQLTSNNPEAMTATGSLLYATFGNGVWQYNGSTWSQLTPYSPEAMVASGSLLYGKYNNGIWQYNGSTWTQLTPYSPTDMIAAGSLLYGKYDNGIWQYNGSTWTQLTPYSPAPMVAAGSLLYGKYDNGIWMYDGSSWSQLTPYSPTAMVAAGSLLYGKYDNGIWLYNGSIWSQVTPSNPEAMVASGSLLYGDFGSTGIWMYNGSTWTQITPNDPASMTGN
jgi:hypothetical protein